MSSATPRLQSVAADIVNLADHERHARQALPPAIAAYFLGGAGDETTLAANRSAWDALALWPRVLRPLGAGHTRQRLLGREIPCPLLIAPMALQCMAHPDGERASAWAAAALGAGLVLSMESSTPLEQVAQAMHAAGVHSGPRPPLWMQLYVQHDRALVCELLARAEAAGFDALVLTVDAPISGVRDRERRARFQPPAGIGPVHLQDMAALPQPALHPGQSAVFDKLLPHAPTWADIDWLRQHTRLPLLLKGILHPLDALQAARLGVDGVIVSNHGGRTLDTTPASAVALPRVAHALREAGAALALLADGGIRRGSDVLKAIALGADAVLIGRPALCGLTNAGAAGVAHVLRLLRDELEIAMALTGCATLADATTALLGPD